MSILFKHAAFKAFLLLDRFGIHLLPKHFYSPVPDYRWLNENREAWTRPSSLTGLGWDLEAQLGWVRQTCHSYYPEVEGLEFFRRVTSGTWGLGFGPIESQVLHCVIRSCRPRKIVEIGSGVSTMCMLNAARKNSEEGTAAPEVFCIEPFPKPALRDSGQVKLLREFCQNVPDSTFASLFAGDLLFVDCSHAVKVGSDVLRIYLEIIPKLQPGVLIHVHDIFLPYLYPRDALTKPFGWQETSLLLALLINNPRLEVLACLSALHYSRSAELKEILGDYQPAANIDGLSDPNQPSGHFPSSMWLRTC